MITSAEQAVAVQARRVEAGKFGVAKAVRRYCARGQDWPELPKLVQRGKGGTSEMPKQGPLRRKREELSAWKEQPYRMGGRR